MLSREMCNEEWHNIYPVKETLKRRAMKNSTNTTVLLKALDLELKAILEKDIKAFKIKQQVKNNATFLQAIAA